MVMKKLLLLAAVVALALAGCGEGEGSADWRDVVDCNRLTHEGTEEMFAADMWNCHQDGERLNVYTFNNSEAREQWWSIAEQMGAEVVQEGDEWLLVRLA